MKTFWLSVCGTLLLLAVSFLGWRNSAVSATASIALCLGVFWLYFYAPTLATGAVIAELAFGGKGWWLSLNVLGEPVSIRFLFFAALLSAWAIQFIASRSNVRTWIGSLPRFLHFPLLSFVIVIVWGVVWGFVRQNGTSHVLLDANAFGYWLLVLPLVSLSNRNHTGEEMNKLILGIAGVGVTLSVLTLALYHVFDHQYPIAETLYHWIRATLLGEITFIRPGAWRIFMQSQVWLLFVWSGAAVGMLMRHPRDTHPAPQSGAPLSRGESIEVPSSGGVAEGRGGFRRRSYVFLYAVILVISSSALIISFSRSYWVGWGVAVILCVSFSVYRLRAWKRAVAVLFLSFVGGFLLTVAVQRIPPIPAGFPLKERIALEEAGSSRIYQLKPLLKAIARHPILGSGFGTTVTYRSADPRIVASTAGGTGAYTTYAFEWGYLDIWLKIGLAGLIGYLWLIGGMMKGLWRAFVGAENFLPLPLALFCSLVAVASVNIFSPYLNHPLGIGMVLLSIAYARLSFAGHV